ncbi:MAG: hypothetical protein JJU33_01695 [Phycisphaerales bacterium]|nr:hypothetical protein [Phycisphaerales bacterium]
MHYLIAENGPVETAQMLLWVCSSLLALGVFLYRKRPRERFFAGWLALVSALAAFRETDGHILLNPEVLGSWGVRYRIDWWLSLDAPVLPRVLWAALAVVMAVGLVIPLVKASPKAFLLIKGRDRAWWLFAIAAAALFVGYACDDLVGRGQFVAPIYSQSVEEISELIGALLFLVAIGLTVRLSLSTRERLARERLKPA